MTRGTVRELVNQIESKQAELHKLKRELRELNQDWRTECERCESSDREHSYGLSVRQEEIEWDIQCTESAIRAISNQVDTLKARLHEQITVRSKNRIATE